MQTSLSLTASIKDQLYYKLESQIRFLNRKVRDLEVQIQQLTQTHISLTTNDGNLFIKIDEIIFCQADSNYTQIHLMDGKKIYVSKTLKYIQSILPDQKFVRIHQSYLVNTLFIKDYHLGNNARMQMKNGQLLSISKAGLQRIYKMFSQKKGMSILRLEKI